MSVPDSYNHQLQVMFNGLHDRAGPQLLTLLFSVLFPIPFYITYRILRRQEVEPSGA